MSPDVRHSIAQFLWVGAGGMIGAVTRYLLLQWLGGVDEGVLPWGTISANVLGSFLLGIVTGSYENGYAGDRTRLFVAVGLLGGFTTFSFFSYENFELLRADRYIPLLTNVALQLMSGLAGAVGGYLFVVRRG